MNSLLQTLSALLAGAFLNLGFERLAEFLDPLSADSPTSIGSADLAAAQPCITCHVPGEFLAVG